MTIKHIEDLSILQFIELLDNLHEYKFTEKVDGSQLLFGLDDNGFYTSRETKGGHRVYNVDEYEVDFKNTFRRAAHAALEKSISKLLAAGLKLGDQVEIEVLYGETPNVVKYSGDTNYIIFLRTTEGSVNIGQLEQEFTGHSLSVSLLSPFTDGRIIEEKLQDSKWEFSQVPEISVDFEDIKRRVYSIKNDLNGYLSRSTYKMDYSNKELVSLNLTKLGKNPNKEIIKAAREDARNFITKAFIMPAKDILLDQLVRSQNSNFGPADGWIEGIVLTEKSTGKMLKLVDKEIFGRVRIFSWEMRNTLYEISDAGTISTDVIIDLLDKYTNERNSRALYIKELKTTFLYTDDIHTRTLEVFASLLKRAGEDEIR